jgi:glycogen(starch) synthase
MHIAFVSSVYPPQIDGFSTYVRDLTTALAELGHRVTVFVGDPHLPGPAAVPSTEGPSDRRVRVISVRSSSSLYRSRVLRRTGLSALLWSYEIYRLVARQHERTPFDLVEFMNWRGQGYVYSLKKPAPQCVRVTTSIGQVAGQDPDRSVVTSLLSRDVEALAVRFIERLEARSVERSDLVIVPSSRHWEVLARRYGVERREVVAVPFGIDVEQVGALSRRAAREGTACRLLYVGRLSRRKGFDLLMGSLGAVCEQSAADVSLTILGEDVGHGAASAWRAHSLALPPSIRSRVRYLGAVSDADRDAAYRGSDVLVAPSRYESFGLMYVEAMAHGLPVVGCRVGGVADVVDDGVTGLLVDPDDPEALTAAVVRLVNEPSLRRRMGDAARATALTRFTRDRMARASAEAYRTLVAGARRRG